MTTLIVGRRSYLSTHLSAALPDSVVCGGSELLTDPSKLESYGGSVRLIINAFRPATRLHDLDDPLDYTDQAIRVTATILDRLTNIGVRKLIYTSSASVYGNNIYCSESDPVRPQDLHAALKLANEHLVADVCEARRIDYTIARVFNMFGGDDEFSIISNLIDSIRQGTELALVNQGHAIRDFIHIDDVVRTYAEILPRSGLKKLNVGTGVGSSIRSIIDTLTRNGMTVLTTSVRRDEIKMSTADTTLLGTVVDMSKFKRVDDYILDVLKG